MFILLINPRGIAIAAVEQIVACNEDGFKAAVRDIVSDWYEDPPAELATAVIAEIPEGSIHPLHAREWLIRINAALVKDEGSEAAYRLHVMT